MKTSLFNRILYATDMSPNAQAAARYALSLAHDYKTHLTVVNVIPDLVEELSASLGYDLAAHYDEEKLKLYFQENLDESKKAVTQRISALCAEVGSKLDDYCLKPDIEIRMGAPVEKILQVAKDKASDLIIVGARGHGLLDEILIGSVARGVMKKSTVPVLTIPLAETQ